MFCIRLWAYSEAIAAKGISFPFTSTVQGKLELGGRETRVWNWTPLRTVVGSFVNDLSLFKPSTLTDTISSCIKWGWWYLIGTTDAYVGDGCVTVTGMWLVIYKYLLMLLLWWLSWTSRSATWFALMISHCQNVAKQVYHNVSLYRKERIQHLPPTQTYTHTYCNVRKQSCIDRKKDNDTQWVVFISNISHSMVLQLPQPTNQLNIIMHYSKHIMK